MPYELKENTPQCDGWGVYKQDTGELVAGGCHVNKPDALSHLAALEIAAQNEGRAAGEWVIVDVDGTLTVRDGSEEPRASLIAWMQSHEYRYAIVSGRPDSRTEETRSWLEDNDVPHDALYLSDVSTAQSPEFKKRVAERLLASHRVVMAIDNGSSARDAYASLGIPTHEPTAVRTIEGENEDMAKTEYRATVAEFKPDAADGFTYRGHVALFDSPSSPALGFTEIIKRGAFSKSLAAAGRAEWEIKAYQDHKPELFLGSTKTGTLSLIEDDRGLLAEIRLNPAVSYASDLAANLRRDGAAMGASFGFSVPAKGERVGEDGSTRELVNVRLHEVSLLTGNDPAYPATVGLGAVRQLAERTNHDQTEVRDAVDALLAGDVSAERAAFLRAILGEVSEKVETVEEPAAPSAPEPAASDGVPVSVREMQLALERLKR